MGNSHQHRLQVSLKVAGELCSRQCARRMEDKDKGIRVWHFEGIRVEFGGVSGLAVALSWLGGK